MSPLCRTIDKLVIRAEGFVIARSARRDWELFEVRHSIEEVVDSLFELPDERVREAAAGTIERPKWRVAHGRVFGRLFMIGGYKNPDGEWIAVQTVAPVDR